MIYHVINKSIAGYEIFPSGKYYMRFKQMLAFFRLEKPPMQYCKFIEIGGIQQENFFEKLSLFEGDSQRLVEILAYCIMPTHIHLLLEEIAPSGISNYMRKLLNSYTRYFNLAHLRKGPLWQGRYKKIACTSDEQLLHLTRYIHLNPVTAYIINNLNEWSHSSFHEYIGTETKSICSFSKRVNVPAAAYKKFCEDRIGYQRSLGKIKSVALD